MLPMLLAQIGLPLLVKAVGGALSNSSNSVAKAAGEALGQVDTEISAGRLDGDQLKEANRHLEAIATLEATTDQTWLQEVNQTIRAESTSEDAYVRRMRPTFGYIMAFTWAAQMGAIAYTVVADPQQAAPVIAAVASLGTIWTVGLSVLGIYVYRRSGEKQRVLEAQGGLPTNQNTGLLQNLFQSLNKSKES
ncbi:MAG: 3TM-type holin [Alphaproteobacteria bacterium]|nr:3TM-type holin [Alphaproteobacteria bacterium]